MRRALSTVLIGCLLVGSAIALAASALAQHVAAQRADPTQPAPQPAPGERPRTPDDPAEVQTGPEHDARRARVLARVGEVRITIGDVEDQIARQSPFMRSRYRDPAQLRELVQNMLRFELLSREAERQGFGDDPEVREATSQSAVQQFIRERFDERITPESIPAADVATYYEAHPEEFSRAEVRRASHILVATREEATALVPRLRAADARTFRSIAQEQSLDAESRARGGDLRYFDDQGRSPNSADPAVDPALVRTAFALGEVGDVSEPVELAGQWSIVKLTGRRPAEHRALAEASPSIRLRLWRERRQQAIDQFVEGLRERTAVEVHYDRMRPITMEPPDRLTDEHAEEGAAAEEGDEGAAVRGHDRPLGSGGGAPEEQPTAH
ncbi:MAG: peptidylprolyl isomerase [Myxococcota bacterium]|nr:peptidylprolyl isomerase [Myxococcota bacterium]